MMKTWTVIAAAAFLTAVLCVTLVRAQAPPPGPPPGPQAGPPPGAPAPPAPPAPPHPRANPRGERPFEGMMEDKELRDMVETVMMAKLATRLGLSDEQALQLVRSRSKFREDTQKLHKERAEKARALETALKAEHPNDADVDAKLKELVAQDEKIASLRRQGFEEVGKNLSTVQRAKLYLFLNEFESDMRQLINRARERGMGGPQGMKDGPPQGPPGARGGMREQFKENVRRNLREGGPLGGPRPDAEAPAPAK